MCKNARQVRNASHTHLVLKNTLINILWKVHFTLCAYPKSSYTLTKTKQIPTHSALMQGRAISLFAAVFREALHTGLFQ